MEVQPRQIENYIKTDGTSPFEEWLSSLRDTNAKTRIRLRLKRVAMGNLGDYRSLGQGVFELRIDSGPGYRVYFGQIASLFVILLCGGDKSSQQKDISKAIEYWRDYYERLKNSN